LQTFATSSLSIVFQIRPSLQGFLNISILSKFAFSLVFALVVHRFDQIAEAKMLLLLLSSSIVPKKDFLILDMFQLLMLEFP